VTEEQHYYYGTGRRKTAVARVRLYPATASPSETTGASKRGGHSPDHAMVVVNEKPLAEYFPRQLWQTQVLRPLQETGAIAKFRVVARVAGGGLSGQAGAVAHGIARALLAADENLRPVLRQAGMLTRDPRVKERKKYGLLSARKAKQSPKR